MYFSSYDFECTQDAVDDNGHYTHVPNFIGCHVMCTKCIADGKWDKPLGPEECELCEGYRYVSFSEYELPDPSVSDHHITSNNPLGSFVDWLLFTGFGRSYRSQCFAHNAGRYGLSFFLAKILTSY